MELEQEVEIKVGQEVEINELGELKDNTGGLLVFVNGDKGKYRVIATKKSPTTAEILKIYDTENGKYV
jgi:hypothetical protein